MVDSKFFVEHIENEAKQTAHTLLTDAENEKLASETLWAQEVETLLAHNKQKMQAQAEQITARYTAATQTEVSRITTLAKQQVFDATLTATAERIANMTDKIYSEWIAHLLITHAQPNDTVIVSSIDSKRITQKFIEAFNTKHNFSLNLSSKHHEGSRGIILKNAKYDKNLTVDSLLESAREDLESDILSILFPVKNG